jgi:hypothetical protein
LHEGGPESYWSQHPQDGMTLRDYFAAKAMQSYAAYVAAADVRFSATYDEIASEAYAIADAMLAARNT